ncbi:Elongation factor 2 [Durusdinium trenchii]
MASRCECRSWPSSKASKSIITNRHLHKSNLGRTFWPEVFSALTMLLPALHGYFRAPDIAASAAFPQGVWALAYAAIFHCPISMAYHLSNAVYDGAPGYDVLCTPFRTADLIAIHLCCVAFGWAESHGHLEYTIFITIINIGCIVSLLHTLICERRGGRHENYLVAFCVFLYTLPVLVRSDYCNYAGIAGSWFLACVFQSLNPKMGGWGHGLFHVMLVPYFHFLMHGAAASR